MSLTRENLGGPTFQYMGLFSDQSNPLVLTTPHELAQVLIWHPSNIYKLTLDWSPKILTTSKIIKLEGYDLTDLNFYMHVVSS